MLKAEPLTVLEVNTYGVGHINRYTSESIETAYDQNEYGYRSLNPDDLYPLLTSDT